eukprot:65833_1
MSGEKKYELMNHDGMENCNSLATDLGCNTSVSTMELNIILCKSLENCQDGDKATISFPFSLSTVVWDLAQAIAKETEMKHDMYLVPTLLISMKRNTVAPMGDDVKDWFEDGDSVVVLGDEIELTEAIPANTEVNKITKSKRKLPVTIITGHLGAGKTTVLNHLLHQQQEKRIAVIENEFGEISLDNEFLATNLNTAETVIVLDNGCMCCTVRGDLLGAFTSILDKMDPERPLDSVLVETTGMADPVPIVRTFLQTPVISAKFELDGVVSLVDAKNIGTRLSAAKDVCQGEVDEAFQQVMFADRIVLNKVDLVSAKEAVDIVSLVRGINPDAPILPCSRGRLHPSHITGIEAFDMAKMIEMDSDLAAPPTHSKEDHHHHHEHHHHEHSHDDESCCNDEHCSHTTPSSRHSTAINSFSLTREGRNVDLLLFSRWMRKLTMLNSNSNVSAGNVDQESNGIFYRSKAILSLEGSSMKLAFHAVSDVMEKSLVGPWKDGEARTCRIVFIGKKLNRPWFEAGFDSCLCPLVPAYLPLPSSPLSSKKRAGFLTLPIPVLGRVFAYLYSKDIAILGEVCHSLASSIFGNNSNHLYAALSNEFGLQTSKPGECYLHMLLPMSAVKAYITSAVNIGVQLPPSGLALHSVDEAEACGVTWLEVAELQDSMTRNYVVEFSWRPETLVKFFSQKGSFSSSSKLTSIDYEYVDTDIDEEVEDTLKFRLLIQPAAASQLPSNGDEVEGSGTASEVDPFAVDQYCVSIQTIGGRSCSQVYMISFHSVDPSFQIHVSIPDHRMPIVASTQLVHWYHPLFTRMKESSRLRFLVRIKPDGSGPLDNLCGCC